MTRCRAVAIGLCALVLVPSCSGRPDQERTEPAAAQRNAEALPAARFAAPAESVIIATRRSVVSRLVLRTPSGTPARATLRLPARARARSLAAVVIAGGFDNGWRTAEWIDPGPGVALLSIDYPFDGPREGIPPSVFLRRARDYWDAVRAMEPLLRQGAAYLVARTEIDTTRILVVGGSLGVPLALRAAIADPRFRGVALLYGAADLGEWTARNLKGAPPLARPIVGAIVGFLCRDYEPERLIGKISPRPVLLVSAKGDDRVPEDLARRLYEAAREPREQVWLSGGHVDLSDMELTESLLGTTVAWAWRHGFIRPGT